MARTVPMSPRILGPLRRIFCVLVVLMTFTGAFSVPALAAACGEQGLGTCTTEGQIIIYDAGNHIYKYCDGTNWVSMAGTDTGVTCSTERQYTWDGTLGDYKFCNGTDWIEVVNGGTLTSCTTPLHGMEYDYTNHVFKWCNGTNWISMAGTSPPDSECVFISSATYPSGFKTVAAANADCQSLATAAGLSGSFQAWISTSTSDEPAATFAASTLDPYKLVDGTTIANNWAGLTSGTLLAGINEDETGASVTGAYAWTNVDYRGLYANTNDCSGWGTTKSNSYGIVGSTDYTSTYWSDYTTQTCNTSQHFYCFEQPCNQPPPPLYKTRNATPNSLITSNIAALPYSSTCNNAVSISGPGSSQFRICSDSTCSTNPAWGTTGTITGTGQYIQLRLTSSSTYGATETASLTIGRVTVSWTVQTQGDRIFISSASYLGNIGSVSAANTDCANLATAAGLSGTWKAWISTTAGTDDPATTFAHSTSPYTDISGTVIANNWTGLTSGTLLAGIGKDETGAAVASGTAVWTNVAANGAATGTTDCSSWLTSSGGSNKGAIGQTGSTSSSWTASGTQSCASSGRLYCVEQPPFPHTTSLPTLYALPSTLVASDIFDISGASTVSISGTNGSPQFQICANIQCSTVIDSWTSSPVSLDPTATRYAEMEMTSSATSGTTFTATLSEDEDTTSWSLVSEANQKLVFVIDATSDGNFGGVSGADSTCNADASLWGLPGTYKAWIAVTAGVDDPATTFTQSTGPYVRAHFLSGDSGNFGCVSCGDAIIANNWTGLTSGTLLAPINGPNYGQTYSVATNVATNGTAIVSGAGTGNCQGWTDNTTGSAYGGSSTSTSSTWTNAGSTSFNCTAYYSTPPWPGVYCFQQ